MMTRIATIARDTRTRSDVYQRLVSLLAGDLDYHDRDSRYASHNMHAFPAKFPPQLPREFILGLTQPGDLVLDPMAGSGTTCVEARLLGRRSLGFDIDLLALLIGRGKTQQVDRAKAASLAAEIVRNAKEQLALAPAALEARLDARFGDETRAFVDYWFGRPAQLELQALLEQIEGVADSTLGIFFRLAFSAIIVTKSGGVSLALDLAHTRPHRAKTISAVGEAASASSLSEGRAGRLTKVLRSPVAEFEKRVNQNLRSVTEAGLFPISPALVAAANAEMLPLLDEAVDLVVTSPPYASNAIDYMRAHKFSLVWFGYDVDELSDRRRTYIGSENTQGFAFETLPAHTQVVVDTLNVVDARKALVVRRYYSEMTRVLREMYRVLRPDACAVVVVGSSMMRGIDTETQHCLAEIATSLGFEAEIGVRHLDRDRRMMPASRRPDLNSQIQQRMHEEYVLGLYKSTPLSLEA